MERGRSDCATAEAVADQVDMLHLWRKLIDQGRHPALANGPRSRLHFVVSCIIENIYDSGLESRKKIHESSRAAFGRSGSTHPERQRCATPCKFLVLILLI